MQDSFGRNINYMRISLTDRCNYACYYCKPDISKRLCHSDILTYEQRNDIEFVYGFNNEVWFSLLSTMKFEKTNDSIKYILSCKIKYNPINILTSWNDLLFRMKLENINEKN